MPALDDLQTKALRMLGTCVEAHSARAGCLEEKMDHEVAPGAKLINLPHQLALPVLTVCMRQNLRHRQRCLQSDGLVHLWEKLNVVLRGAVARTRGFRRPREMKTQMMSLWATSAKSSFKSTPSICEYPLATRRAL